MNGNEGYVDASSYIATNGCIDPNSTMPVYSNGHAVGIDNINFLGEEIDTSENRGFEIEYIQFPDQVIKVQVRLSICSLRSPNAINARHETPNHHVICGRRQCSFYLKELFGNFFKNH